MEAELTGPVSNMWQTLTKKASTSVLPEKAIVFSQFLEHINVIEAQVRYSESRTVQCIILVFIMDVEHNSMTVRILEWEASFSIIRMCSCWELDCLKHPYKCWPNVNSRKSENYYCIYQNHIPTLIFWFFCLNSACIMLPHKFDFSSLLEVWATWKRSHDFTLLYKHNISITLAWHICITFMIVTCLAMNYSSHLRFVNVWGRLMLGVYPKRHQHWWGVCA